MSELVRLILPEKKRLGNLTVEWLADSEYLGSAPPTSLHKSTIIDMSSFWYFVQNSELQKKLDYLAQADLGNAQK